MEEVYAQDVSVEVVSRIRDMEERQRLLKDRISLIGETLVKERDRTLKDIQEMKRSLILIKEENGRIKELLERVTEQLTDVARREELLTVQRQLDLLRK